MTRFISVLGAIFCIGMIFPMVATEQVRGGIDFRMAIVHGVSELVLAMSLLLYCGFAALHSVSRVGNPCDRMAWIILTLGLNVLGSLIYYLTKYQDFRANGMGGFVRPQKNNGQSFYRATPSELNTER